MSPTHDIVTLEQIISRVQDERFPDMKPERFFEHFVAEQILKEHDLSDDQLVSGNVGGPSDGGIDAIHLFVAGDHIDDTNVQRYKDLKRGVQIELHIIQAKNKNRMESSVISTFRTMANDLLKPGVELDQLRGRYNSRVLQAFEWFWEILNALRFTTDLELNVIFSYATKAGGPTKKMRDSARKLESSVTNYIHGCTCRCDFLGATELLDLSRKTPQQRFELTAAKPPLAADFAGRSYIALVTLDEYYRFITAGGAGLQSRLFESNVRDWQGDNKVNSQIRATLSRKDANDFWWLNNGVTMLVQSMGAQGNILGLENPEIVNGLQTSRAIWEYFRTLPADTKDVRQLLIRIITVSDENDSRETVIRATNSQTTVPTYALRSLDRVHRNIEEYFLAQANNKLYYDRRKNFYKNQRKPARSIIDLRTLAQAVIATGLGKPDDAKGRPSDYLGASDDEKYRAVFDDDTHPAFYLFCARLYKLVEQLLRHESIDEAHDAAQRRSVRFHIMTYVISRHMKLSPSQLSKSINEIANLSIEDLEVELVLDSIHRVLGLLGDFRTRLGSSRMKWSEFEDYYFDDLGELLRQQVSP